MTHFNKLGAEERMNVLAAMEKLNELIKEEDDYNEMPQQQQQSFHNFGSLGRDANNNKTFDQLKAEYYANPHAFSSRKSIEAQSTQSSRVDHKRRPSRHQEPQHHHHDDEEEEQHGEEEEQEEEEEEEGDYEEGDSRRDRSANKQGTIVDRLYDLEARKREKLAAKQFQRYKDELASLKPKPDISLNSRIIAEQKKTIPIYERSYVTIKQKEDRLNRMRAELEQRKIEQELANTSYTYRPQTGASKSYISYDRTRTPEEFAAQVYAWQHKRNENLQRDQYDALTEELSKLTFKPKINTRSKFLAEKNQYVQENVEDRLIKTKEMTQERRKRLADENLPAFKPVLNEKSNHIMRLKRGEERHRDLSANNSYSDVSQDNGGRRTKNNGRSFTPTPSRKPHYAHKSLKFNVIQYTPEVDFLLKKLK